MDINLIEHKFNILPDDLKKEALDFIDYLIMKKKHKKFSAQFDFTWEGGLADFKGRYTSVELQHQSMEWR